MAKIMVPVVLCALSCLAASWSPASWEQNAMDQAPKDHKGSMRCTPPWIDLQVWKSMILQNSSKWNIVQWGNRSWKYKVSHTSRHIKAYQGLSRQSSSHTDVGRGSSRAKCWFRSGRSLMNFCACVESCWLQPVKPFSDSAEAYRAELAASAIHVAIPKESVYSIQTLVHMQLGKRP